MQYTPHRDPRFLGVWTLDGTETVADVKAAILAERKRAATAWGWPLLKCMTTFPTLTTHRHPPAFRAPAPGTDTPTHTKAVAAAIALCERHGAEFWALGPRGRVWGVQAGRYVEVRDSGCHEVAPTG